MEWGRPVVTDCEPVRRQRQATRRPAKTTAVAGKDKKRPSWRLEAVENTWMITVLFSPLIGSLINTVALIDLSKSSLIMSSSRRAPSVFISSSFFFSKVGFNTLSLSGVLKISLFFDSFASCF